MAATIGGFYQIFQGRFRSCSQEGQTPPPPENVLDNIILVAKKAGVKELRGVTKMTTPPFPAPAGFRWVFCKSFKHYRTGKQVFPKKSDCFCFLVRA